MRLPLWWKQRDKKYINKAIGIDLGTTYCVAAVMQVGTPVIIPCAEGGNLVPSVVAIDGYGNLLVGQRAQRQAVMNPENTIYSVKRLIGRKFNERTVQDDISCLPYKITEASNGDCRVVMGGNKYSPQEISAMILQKLKADAEAYLGEKVEDAVITVPSYFNDSQRNATRDAGAIAGLNVVNIISEPTAAALAYGLNSEEDETIAVYDLGGGTFNITILDVGGGSFQVKSTNGDNHLGGDDFDRRIIDWLCSEFKRDRGRDITQDKTAIQRIKEAAEKAKVELSTVAQTEIDLPFIIADAKCPEHLNITLNRANLERLCTDLVERTIEPCRQALSDAGLKASQINTVVVVGDQTRMPLVQEMVTQFFGKEISRRGIDIDKAVAVGAAIRAGVLKGEVGEVLLLDVAPLTLGIETLGGVATPLIPRNTTIPTSKSQIFSTTSDNQTSVEIHILQGESPVAADNCTLGRFVLDDIPPAPQGKAQIDVTFDIDANGILNVTAKDKQTRKKQKITITAYSGLSKWEVQQMKQEAEERTVNLRARQSENNELP